MSQAIYPPHFPLSSPLSGRFSLIYLSFLFFLVLALAPFHASCQILDRAAYDELIRGLEPVDAMVLSVSADFVILSCGSGNNIEQGDLFTVYGKGRPVSDPETGQNLGYLKRPVALVQVVSVEKTRCECRVLTSESPMTPGLPTTRYEDVRAFFTSKIDQPAAIRLRDRLRRDLPHIVWVPGSAGAKPGENALTFVLEAQRLDLYGPGGRLLRSYPLAVSLAGKAGKSGVVTPGIRVSSVSVPAPGLRWKGVEPLGYLPAEALQVMVFDLAGNGELETVYLTDTGLYVYPFRRRGTMAAYAIRSPGVPQGFSCYPGLIALNILMPGIGMRSVLLRYTGSQLVEVRDDINLWLSFVDRDGDGRAESLLAQGYDPDVMFTHDVYMAEPGTEGLHYRRSLKLPPFFNVTRAQWYDLNGNGEPELITLDYNRELRIYESGDLLSTIDLKLLPGAVPSRLTRLIPYDVNGDGLREIVFGGSNGPGGKGHILALFWSGARYSVSVVSKPIKGALCGLSFDDRGQLLAAVVRQQEKERQGTLLYVLD